VYGCSLPWFHICHNHPFVDGNKRTGANAAITFLPINAHREIVKALTVDSELGWLLNQIVARDPRGRVKNSWANWMMSWFSRKITEQKNPYADGLERYRRQSHISTEESQVESGLLGSE
jgi:hypothetical protein